MRTDVHNDRHIQEQMKDTKSVKHYQDGYKIVWWPERMQPYTVWKCDSVLRFCETLKEAETWVGKVNI